MSSLSRTGWVALPALVGCVWLSGCGTPAAPQPPSLNLPDAVTDLTATRAGNEVALSWTMPKRNTDKTPVKESVTARICRREGTGACTPVGTSQSVIAGKPASYTDVLSGMVASGDPRPVAYFVELLNKKSRSAGLSNAAEVLAGAAPEVVEGLKAEVRRQGVVLRWTPDDEKAAIRLERKLLSPLPARSQAKSQEGPLAATPEPVYQSLLVEADNEGGRAIDENAHFDETYEYRALRLVKMDVNGKTLELAGAASAPIEVDVRNVFPPAVPSGLVAVASARGNGTGPSIDLNWLPDSELDLVGYIVYRREGDGAWQRVSPAATGLEPAFHDTQVQPGRSYRYAVSAIDKGGHESKRSTEAEETVPQQ